jgi:SAM-dependent methyltransferase
MAGWDDGYVSDVVYTRNFHRETTPAWLAAAALLSGHRPPDLARPFRYADLGCGHGLTAIVVAATCPHAEVWGFDFNPAHVESARELASRAGLTNVRFEETSFQELALQPASALPAFEFMVAHGILSWVSRENQRHVTQVIGQRLRPGGLAYLSYNVATGWGAMPPLRALMRMLLLSAGDRTDRAAPGVLDFLETMKQAGAGFFAANPSLEQRLAEIRRQDPRYIAHEFLNQDWHPLMFADVAEHMAEAKCGYVGSATLAENFDSVSVPRSMSELIAQAFDPVLRETLRDFATAQEFRRDIYRRGVAPVPAPEHLRLLDALPLQWIGHAVAGPISLPTPLGALAGSPDLYGSLVEVLTARGSTLGEIRRHTGLANYPLPALLEAVAVLIGCGYAHPALPAAVQTAARGWTDRLNAEIGSVNGFGFDIGWLASPAIGSALKTDLLETLVVRESADGQSLEIEGLTDRLLAVLGRAGRSVQRDGEVVTDPIQSRAVLRETVRQMVDERMPLLERLGITAR